MPVNAGKNTASRVQPYLDWLHFSGRNWLQPDLVEYKQYLLDSGLADSSVAAHIYTIRGRYKALMKQNRFRELLFEAAGEEDFVRAKLLVDEKMSRLTNALGEVDLRTTTYQDREAHTHLTEAQVNDFLGQLQSVRDVALFKLMLSTALRASEVVALEVPDIFQVFAGQDAVEVRHGKGDKQRMVPWGGFRSWAMPAIEAWLAYSGITEGALFRGLWKNGKPRPTPMNPASINFILESYPIMHRGQLYTITPHDLRYTYARWAYLAGMPVHAIQANLGHADMETTWIYIGAINVEERAPSWSYGI